MPANVKQIFDLVRDRMDRPTYRSISDQRLANILTGESDALHTELELANKFWHVRSVPMTVSPGDDWITITAADFYIPTALETRDDSDVNHNTRSVDIVNPVELVRFYNGGDLGPQGTKWSARAVAFGEHPVIPDARAMRLGPKCNEACEYTLVYEPMTVRPTSLAGIGFTWTQFEGYLVDRIALRGLVYAKWDGLSGVGSQGQELSTDQLNAVRRKELTDAILPFFKDNDDRFQRAKRRARTARSLVRHPYGSGRW